MSFDSWVPLGSISALAEKRQPISAITEMNVPRILTETSLQHNAYGRGSHEVAVPAGRNGYAYSIYDL
jgi:hypothetical protein